MLKRNKELDLEAMQAFKNPKEPQCAQELEIRNQRFEQTKLKAINNYNIEL